MLRRALPWLRALIDRRPLEALAASGGLSLLLYGLCLVRPAFLFASYTGGLVRTNLIANGQLLNLMGMFSVCLALFGLFLLGWRAARQLSGNKAAWALVIGASLAFGGALLFMYPYGSADIFDYILRSRIWTAYGVNPYLGVGNQYPNDPFFPLAYWTDAPTPYGPLWELLAAPVSRLGGINIFKTVLLFKGLSALFLYASAGLAAWILLRREPDRALPGALLILWNPMLLYETCGNGHNDTVMMCFVLLAVLLLDRRRYSLGLLALVAGGLVKFLPWFLLPAAGLIALRELPDAKLRLRFVLRTGLAAAGLLLLAYAPFWAGAQTLSFLIQSTRLIASYPAAIYHALSRIMDSGQAAALVGRAAMLGAVLYALWLGGRAWRDRHWTSFTRQAALFFIGYFALFSPWTMPWYTNWMILIGCLLAPGLLLQSVLALNLFVFTRDFLFQWLYVFSATTVAGSYDFFMITGGLLPAVWVWMIHWWKTRPVEPE